MDWGLICFSIIGAIAGYVVAQIKYIRRDIKDLDNNMAEAFKLLPSVIVARILERENKRRANEMLHEYDKERKR
jgi:hypothetical protein